MIAQFKAPEGWAGVADRGTQVLVDTRITQELAREGMAREVVRHVVSGRWPHRLELELVGVTVHVLAGHGVQAARVGVERTRDLGEAPRRDQVADEVVS